MARYSAGTVLPGGQLVPTRGEVLWGADDAWGWTTVGVPSGGPPWTTHPGIETAPMLNRKCAIRNNATQWGKPIQGSPLADGVVTQMVTYASTGGKYPILPTSQNPAWAGGNGDTGSYVTGGHTYYGSDRILHGQYDAQLTTALNAVSALSASGKTVFFRPQQEMNIPAMAAGGGYQGSTVQAGAAKTLAVFQYEHALAASLSITNLAWIWCLSYDAGGPHYSSEGYLYYPGDQYVDIIAIDPYRTLWKGAVDYLYDFACGLIWGSASTYGRGTATGLTSAVTSGATTLPLGNTAGARSTGGRVMLNDGTNQVTATYTGVSGLTLTGVSGVTHNYANGTPVQICAEKPFMASEFGFHAADQVTDVDEWEAIITAGSGGSSRSGDYDETFATVLWNHSPQAQFGAGNQIDVGTGALQAFQAWTSRSGWIAMPSYSSTDTTNPTGPTTLTAVGVSNTEVDLAWSGASDNVGVDHYQVWRGGVKIADPVYPSSYQDTGLTKNTSYSYQVKAVDAAGNVSTTGATATGKTLNTGGGTSGAGVVQSKGNFSTTTVTSLTVTPAAHTASGNMLVLVFQGNTKATNVSGVTDSASNAGWVNLGVTQSGEASAHLEVWGCPNANSVSTVTVSVASAEKMSAMLIEASGIVTTSPVDVAAGLDDSTSSASHTTPNAVTAHAADLLVAACALGAGSSAPMTSGGAWLETADVAASGAGLGVATQIVSATGTYSATFTAKSPAQGVASLGIVALKATAGGGGGGGVGGPIAVGINHARWIFICTVCGNGVLAPQGTTAVTCPECNTNWSPTYPSDPDTIAQALVYRPSVDLINWTAGESVDALTARNTQGGWLTAPTTVTALETIR